LHFSIGSKAVMMKLVLHVFFTASDGHWRIDTSIHRPALSLHHKSEDSGARQRVGQAVPISRKPVVD
jgi:hypothetical protein